MSIEQRQQHKRVSLHELFVKRLSVDWFPVPILFLTVDILQAQPKSSLYWAITFNLCWSSYEFITQNNIDSFQNGDPACTHHHSFQKRVTYVIFKILLLICLKPDNRQSKEINDKLLDESSYSWKLFLIAHQQAFRQTTRWHGTSKIKDHSRSCKEKFYTQHTHTHTQMHVYNKENWNTPNRTKKGISFPIKWENNFSFFWKLIFETKKKSPQNILPSSSKKSKKCSLFFSKNFLGSICIQICLYKHWVRGFFSFQIKNFFLHIKKSYNFFSSFCQNKSIRVNFVCFGGSNRRTKIIGL